MSKKNDDIASRIAKKFASVQNYELPTERESVDKSKKRTNKSVTVYQATLIGPAGYAHSAEGKNKTEALNNLANDIASDLNSGTLSLADEWDVKNL